MRASSSLCFLSQAPHLCAASSANNYFTHQLVEQIGTTAWDLCKRKDQELSPSTLVTTWFRLSELLASPGQPEQTFSIVTLQQKFKTWTSHGSDDMAQFSICEHLKIVCQTDGRGYCASGPVRNKWQIKIIKTLLMEMINEKELSCTPLMSFLHARASCWDLTTDDICHLWDSKNYHLLKNNIPSNMYSKKGKVINNDTVS